MTRWKVNFFLPNYIWIYMFLFFLTKETVALYLQLHVKCIESLFQHGWVALALTMFSTKTRSSNATQASRMKFCLMMSVEALRKHSLDHVSLPIGLSSTWQLLPEPMAGKDDKAWNYSNHRVRNQWADITFRQQPLWCQMTSPYISSTSNNKVVHNIYVLIFKKGTGHCV